MADGKSRLEGMTPGDLAEVLEKRLRDEIGAIRDPEIRREAEHRLHETVDQLRSASADQEVIEKGPLAFFRDLRRRRREQAASRRRKRMGYGLHVDEFGFDRAYWRSVEPFFRYLYESYWRIETSGLENVPIEGRGILVANHSGLLPWDSIMLREAVQVEHPAQRHVRPLIEDFAYTMPFLGPFLLRIGIARADRQNAERLLAADKLIATFPEGIKGITKLFRDRYQLQRFGRGGTIRLAVRTKSPIIPTAIIGGEEIYPILAEAKMVGGFLGLPKLPITPTFPFLGLLGLVPLPSKWYIRFGTPIDLSHLGEEDLKDDILVNRLNEDVRAQAQTMVHDLLRSRRSAWVG